MIRPVLVLFVLATSVLMCGPVVGQGIPLSIRPPDQTIGGVPTILYEHGDPALAVPPTAGVIGLMIFDIATASSSANRHNLLDPGNPVSPKVAMRRSLFATVVPITAALFLGNTADDAIAPAIVLGAAGVVIGPSMGHFYSHSTRRGLVTAALRAGLGFVAFGLAMQAS